MPVQLEQKEQEHTKHLKQMDVKHVVLDIIVMDQEEPVALHVQEDNIVLIQHVHHVQIAQLENMHLDQVMLIV